MDALSFISPKQQVNELYNKISQISNNAQSSFQKTMDEVSNQGYSQINDIKDFVVLNQASDSGSSISSQIYNVIQNSIGNIRKVFRKAEVSSVEALLNKGDAADLMASLTEAQITLKTTKAVIEKLIEMYKQFENMPL